MSFEVLEVCFSAHLPSYSQTSWRLATRWFCRAMTQSSVLAGEGGTLEGVSSQSSRVREKKLRWSEMSEVTGTCTPINFQPTDRPRRQEMKVMSTDVRLQSTETLI